MLQTSGRRGGARISLLMLSLGVAPLALAHEGMWMPKQSPEIAGALKSAGLTLDPTRLSRVAEFPLGAIVSVDGCSASFVSPQGLIATNHHCAYGSIQYNSTAEKNLLRDGFRARTRAEELRAAPGSHAYVTVDVQDVTARILDAETAGLTGGARTLAIQAREKVLIADCERDVGHRCIVSSFYGGAEYQLIKRLEIRDVRLVYAPPSGVGKFGGDTDNWMWPRHTGDFSFYRAYVGRDGKPADYNKNNRPYEPRHHLKVAAQGVQEGDFVMVAGYPRITYRYRLPSEIEFAFEWEYPAVVKAGQEQLQIIAQETTGREAAGIAYAGLCASINNIAKRTQGLLDRYERAVLLDERRRETEAVKAWVNGDPGRAREYGADLAAVEELLARRNAISQKEFLLPYATPRLLAAARALYQLAREKAKRDDSLREPGYQQRDWPMIEQGIRSLDKRYDQQVDKALTRHFITQHMALPEGSRNDAFLAALGLGADMSSAEIDAALDRLYAGSRLSDLESRLAWLQRKVGDFESSDDSFIKAAVLLHGDDVRRRDRDRELDGDIQRAYASYMKALIAYRKSRGEAVYPDANSTLRISFGNVAGRVPGDADGTAWTAFTTLDGIVAQHTGEGEFNAPRVQLDAIKARRFGQYADPSLRTVPVNFLATLDISGGNSGSAVLNARGEFVGLAFDNTLDSVMSGWRFDSARTRTIAVDVRYMLWYMDVVEGAHELLRELGV